MSSIADVGFAIGVYSSRDQAERAVQALERGNFDLRRLSIVDPRHVSDGPPPGAVGGYLARGGPGAMLAFRILCLTLGRRLRLARGGRASRFALVYRGWREDAVCAREALQSAKATAAGSRDVQQALAV